MKTFYQIGVYLFGEATWLTSSRSCGDVDIRLQVHLYRWAGFCV